jgi:hypothetical protein
VIKLCDRLKKELEERLARARAEGLVHVGCTVNVNMHSTTRELLVVLNNVLRLRENEDRKPTLSV